PAFENYYFPSVVTDPPEEPLVFPSFLQVSCLYPNPEDLHQNRNLQTCFQVHLSSFQIVPKQLHPGLPRSPFCKSLLFPHQVYLDLTKEFLPVVLIKNTLKISSENLTGTFYSYKTGKPILPLLSGTLTIPAPKGVNAAHNKPVFHQDP